MLPRFRRDASTNAERWRAAHPAWQKRVGSVAVFGLGVSGVAVLKWALEQPAGRVSSIAVVDSNSDSADVLALLLGALPDDERVVAYLGQDASSLPGEFDLGVISPGIPPESELGLLARASCRAVISEVELAFRESVNPWVAITGTNGKTTTTALATHLLIAGGVPAAAVGNIGVATIDAVREMPADTVMVAEVSSFQLDAIQGFCPEVAMVINITPDHTDWHGSLESYALAKCKVYSNQREGDLALWCSSDSISARYIPGAIPGGVAVAQVALDWAGSANAGMQTTFSVSDGMLLAVNSTEVEHICPVDRLQIAGAHNQVNALFAAAVAMYFGLPLHRIAAGLASFQPVPHRLQLVGTVGGVRYYNDSKATNPDATVTAVRAFPGEPILLLVGGRNKGSDFSELAAAVAPSVRWVGCFGESRAELHDAFSRAGAPSTVYPGMAPALLAAASAARPGDIVLLSPACASFDEFRSFSHRGDVFRALVNDLSERN